MRLNTYLNYGGNCRQAFQFYEQHLGGKITQMTTHGQAPPNLASDAASNAGPSAAALPPGWEDAVLHARITIGDAEVWAADVPPDRFQPMRSAYLALNPGSVEETERIFHLLSDGGQVFMPLQETFFALRFAMLRDKFGASWMLIHERGR